jgi:hypothetical protein
MHRLNPHASLSRWVAAAIVAAAGSLMAAVPAWAATSTTGIDVSWPQCGHSLPNGEAFAIVGVNGGLANDYNTCLSTEFSYAQRSTGSTPQAKAQLYLNTADPGHGVADWPSPNQPGAYGNNPTPDGNCGFASGTTGPGANSTACAYVYGYDMVRGITAATEVIAGDIPDFHSVTGGQLYNYPTWLDVETGNSWLSGSSGRAMNVADLQGMVDSVHAAAAAGGITAAPVGIYSTSYQWGQITGTPGSSSGNLWNIPDWIPGARQKSGAVSNCSLPAFTEAGRPTITQWFGHPYDGDYSCV